MKSVSKIANSALNDITNGQFPNLPPLAVTGLLNDFQFAWLIRLNIPSFPFEVSLEEILQDPESISFRKTKRAERIEGFDQTPDFIIPSEFNPQVIIEAKITEDDGTARDKVTRIQHLGELSLAGRSIDNPKYEVIACIGGRGFAVRREDMKKMILATRGKVFTAKTLNRLVDCTRLKEFKAK